MLRSASGTTPPMKTYTDLPLHFQKAEVSFGVGYEPVFADVSYAFTVALRRAHLSIRNPIPPPQPPKKEKSLPWWDDMRNYIHGKITLSFSETRWNILATSDPYEKLDKLHIISGDMEIQQSDGRIFLSVKDFKVLLSSLVSLVYRRSLKVPDDVSTPFLVTPSLTVEVLMVWGCDSGQPLNHYLFALPIERKAREIVFDPFRSTSLSLQFNISLRPTFSLSAKESLPLAISDSTCDDEIGKSQNVATVSPTVNIAAHDLVWLNKFGIMQYLPPHKLRMFSRWPRFGVPRFIRSGNLSLDRVMTEFMFRIDATPICINNIPLHSDDPSKGLTFDVKKLKFEICQSRGKQKFTFECKRETLDLVYLGLDIHMPKALLDIEDCTSASELVQNTRKTSQPASLNRDSSEKFNTGCTEKQCDDRFLLSSDYFTIRKQAPKADPARLLSWQEAGKNLDTIHARPEFEKTSGNDEHTHSDPSDDEGYDVVIADSCLRVFIFGFKLLWTVENRNAVLSFAGGLSKAFSPSKPSPSRQYAQRKLLEEKLINCEKEMPRDEANSPSISQELSSPSTTQVENSESHSTPSQVFEMGNLSPATISENGNLNNSEEEGTCHFMVNIIEPQFNLEAVEANDRFLLAAVSGRILARSFHSVVRVGYEMIQQAVGDGNGQIPESEPNMTWKRMELSVMLERVQAHVAPTDVDLGAGVQWLPKIHKSSPKVNRTGVLLERVFMPCDLYFRYTRHKSGSSDLKVKPLKELSFNTDNITATMTSRQFRVLLDVLTNLLFARAPKARKSILSLPAEDDDDDEEVADEVVPDGVEEVELAKVMLEHKEWGHKLLLDDIKKLSVRADTLGILSSEKEGDFWMVTGGRSILVQGLKRELANAKKSRKEASESLRKALQNAAQQRLQEKENKSPSYAMRVYLQLNKVVWSMIVDGKSFAEAEINDMIYDFDRDYKDIGVAQFTTKYFIVRNCLPDAKSDVILSASNPPADWGKKVMLRVDAKQGALREGIPSIELFQVEIFPIPIKIYWTESIAKILWSYLFPNEERDSTRRQEVWKVSTSAGSKGLKKGSALMDDSKGSKLQNVKENASCGSPVLRRTSSFDRTWEETVAESIANELVSQVNSTSISSPKAGAFSSFENISKNKSKNSKLSKSGGRPSNEEKTVKPQEGKRSAPQKVMYFHNVKISQVELIITYGIVINKKLLIDTFHRAEFTGTWTKMFTRIKHHFIWGAVKSVTGMKVKKGKDKAQSQKESSGPGVPDSDLNFSDDDGGQAGKSDQQALVWPKRPADGAGDGFVTSIRGLFNTQRRKAKAFVLRTMKGEEENDFQGEWSEGDVDFSPFARQLTITKAKKLIRRHTKKFHSRKGSSSRRRDSIPSLPGEDESEWPVSPHGEITPPSNSEDSSDSSTENVELANNL